MQLYSFLFYIIRIDIFQKCIGFWLKRIDRILIFKIDYYVVVILLFSAILVSGIDYASVIFGVLGAPSFSLYWKAFVAGLSWGVVTGIVKIPHIVRAYDPRPVPLFVVNLIVFLIILAVSVVYAVREQLNLGWFVIFTLSGYLGKAYAWWRETAYRHERWRRNRG